MGLVEYEECLKRKKVNHSRAREAIYKIFLDNINSFLSVGELHKRLEVTYPKKVSLNTIYRHLNLFVSCNLVLTVQDDNKKAYFIVSDNKAPIFEICPQCQSIDIVDATEEQVTVLGSMMEINKKAKASFIVLHRGCYNC